MFSIEPFDTQSNMRWADKPPPSQAVLHCPPSLLQVALQASRHWMARACMRPASNEGGILVAGVDFTADSMDPQYIHDKQDTPENRYIGPKDRVTDIYGFVQIPYQSLMLGVASVHWSRNSVVPKRIHPYLAWTRNGLHFSRPETDAPLLNHSSIDVARLHRERREALPASFFKS